MAAAAVALGSVQSATASPAAASADRVIAFDQPTGEIRGYCPATNLTVIGQDGTHRRMLVKNGGRPSWSPDGSRIVFQRLNASHVDLWVVNRDDTGLRRLTFLGRGQSLFAGSSWFELLALLLKLMDKLMDDWSLSMRTTMNSSMSSFVMFAIGFSPKNGATWRGAAFAAAPRPSSA